MADPIIQFRPRVADIVHDHAAAAPAEEHPYLQLPVVPDLTVITAGGQAGQAGVWFGSACYRNHQQVGLLNLDNDRRPLAAVPLLDGTGDMFSLPKASRFVIPPEGDSDALLDRKAAIAKHDLLRRRYLDGPDPLWRGIDLTDPTLAEQTRGSGAYRALAIGDIDRNIDVYMEALVDVLRRTHRQRATPAAQDRIAQAVRAHQSQPPEPEHFCVVAATTIGSFGAASATYLGYLIRAAAKRLRQQQPRVYLLLAGWTSYFGLHERVLTNYLSTLDDLTQLARYNGMQRQWLSSVDIPADPQRPYDQVILLEAPRPEANPLPQKAKDATLQAMQRRMALAIAYLCRPEVRDACLGHGANPDRAEQQSITAHRAGMFSILSMTEVGFELRAVAELSAHELAKQALGAVLGDFPQTMA